MNAWRSGQRRRKLNPEGHEGHEEGRASREALARVVVDAGFKVHRTLGPGLLESAYEHCLVYELQLRGISARRQVVLPIVYEGATLDAGYRLDLLVEEKIVVEVKATEGLTPIHLAQILTYLKLSKHRLGFLMNFNVPQFRNGLKKVVL